MILRPKVLRMVRVVYLEWLRYAICNMDPWLTHTRNFLLSSNTFSSVKILFIFVIRGNEILISVIRRGYASAAIRDSLFLPFMNSARDRPHPHCTTLVIIILKSLYDFENYFIVIGWVQALSQFSQLHNKQVVVWMRLQVRIYSTSDTWKFSPNCMSL